MAGWALINSTKNFSIETRADHLRKSLSEINEAVSFTHTKLNDYNHLILWSFRQDNHFPDAKLITRPESSEKFFLHGSVIQPEKIIIDKENINETLSLFNGSFFAAIPKDEKIILAADRIASQPVWINYDDECWVAANHTSVISLLKKNKTEIDEISLFSFFATARHFGKYGLFRNFINLNGGEYAVLTFSDSCYEIKKWFSFKYEPANKKNKKDFSLSLGNHLCKSAKRIFNNSKDVFLFLSGGMDSRVAAAALGPEAKGITISTVYNMNSRISEKVAQAVGMEHKIIYRDPHWYLNSFKEAAFIAGGNYKIVQAHFIPAVKQLIKEKPAAVFLLGDMLENFNKHYYKNKTDISASINIPEEINKIFSYSHPDFNRLKKVFKPEFISRVEDGYKRRINKIFSEAESVSANKSDQLDYFFRWQNAGMCPTYLMLECIVPYAGSDNLMFSNEMIDLLQKVPVEIKAKGYLHNSVLKILKRKLLFIANSNFWLPPITPVIITKLAKYIRPYIGKFRRRKMNRTDKVVFKNEGSWDLLYERYRKDEAYKLLIQENLTGESLLPEGIFDNAYIGRIFNDFMNGELKYQYEIDSILSLNLLLKSIKYKSNE